MPNYTRFGKIQQPMTDQDFTTGLQNGRFVKEDHKSFCVLLYYSAVRKKEALRATREQFTIVNDWNALFFSVGKRLKHGIETPELLLPFDAPYMNLLLETVKDTKDHRRVFPYSDKTGYNIVARAFKYPHLFRLSRITNFFLEGWTIPQVHSWTGLTLKALDYYLGLVDVAKMGESLGKKKQPT